MFVVACHNLAERPVIYECVEAIQRWHPDDHILIVDSDSPDRSYMDWATDRGCNVADIHNHGYAHGAFRFGVRAYPNEDWYALIFDSLILQGSLSHLQSKPITFVRHWPDRQHDWGWNSSGVHLSVWGNRQIHKMGISFPSAYTGVLGPMMFAQRSIIDRLEKIGYFDINVTDAYEHCGLERVCGIVCEALDIDVAANSLQGVHVNHDSHYDESVVRKIDMARA